MARLVNQVGKETDNFRRIDDDLAYAVWIVEKEFNVGAITESFSATKFFNLLDNDNCDRYNKALNSKSGKGGSGTSVFGGGVA